MPGNEASMLNIFVDESGQKNKLMKKEVKRLNVLYSEQTFRDRMGCVRGGFHQNEGIVLITQEPWEFPEKARQRLDLLGKSNRSDSIGAMSWQPWQGSWQLAPSDKKILLGSNRVDVGGPSGLTVPAPPNTAGKEIVFFHCMTDDWYNLLLEDYPIDATIDTSPGHGGNALAHIRARKPYLGICMTTKHCELLLDRLVSLTFGKMLDEADTVMYDPQLATLVQKANPKATKPKPPKAPKKVDDDDKTAKKAKNAKAKADETDPAKVAKKTKPAKDKGKDDGPPTKKPKTKADLMNLLASLKKGGGDGATPAGEPDDDSDFDDPDDEEDSNDDDK
jgi:hypothetical protein